MKYKFASPEWCAFLHGAAAHAAWVGYERSRDFKISLCEVLFDVPPDRGPEGRRSHLGELAWSMVSDGPNFTFEFRERNDLGSKLRVEFECAATHCKFDSTDPLQSVKSKLQWEEAQRTGEVKIEKMAQGPAADANCLTVIHNLVARVTE
jgi:hypothetical protein